MNTSSTFSSRPSSFAGRHPSVAVLLIAGAIVASLDATRLDASNNPDCDSVDVESIREAHLSGDRQRAESLARQVLTCPGPPRVDLIALHLELATILDRNGLHTNTRPVVEALDHLERAHKLLSEDDGPQITAQVELGFAKYYYRAEMQERRFVTASRHAVAALALFESIPDPVGITDTVHRQGLIALQQQDLDNAQRLFDLSLEHSQQTDERPLFLADYHRHTAFVHLRSGRSDEARESFERSHQLRTSVGARDHALFSGLSLASALVDSEEFDRAEELILVAQTSAKALDSPFAQGWAVLLFARLQERQGRYEEASATYEQALEMALAIGSASREKAAREGLERLADPTPRR